MKQKRKSMWRWKDIHGELPQALINGKWVAARPVNYTPEYCPWQSRLIFAFYVLIGKAETFTWPEQEINEKEEEQMMNEKCCDREENHRLAYDENSKKYYIFCCKCDNFLYWKELAQQHIEVKQE